MGQLRYNRYLYGGFADRQSPSATGSQTKHACTGTEQFTASQTGSPGSLIEGGIGTDLWSARDPNKYTVQAFLDFAP